MSDKIEPNCLAVTVAHSVVVDVPADYLVRVVESFDPTRLRLFLLERATHCQSCAKWCLAYLDAFGTDHHWVCEFEDKAPPNVESARAVLHERMLRRLPPPDIEKLITSKDASVPA